MSTSEQSIAATDLMAGLDFNLPAGFELIASDPQLGPQILTSLARIEERLAEAISYTDKLADVAAPTLTARRWKARASPLDSACRRCGRAD